MHTTLPISPLGMLLHCLEKLKIQIFCRYSADMKENANKLHLYVDEFCSKFRMLSSSEKIENRLRLDKVAETIKVGTFLRHSVY